MTGVPAVTSLRPPTQVVLWDFDGTLAHRTDRRRGALLTALDRVDPEHGVTLEDLRPGLRDGFPWHRPVVAHPQLSTSSRWWGELSERFAMTYRIAGVSDHVARRAAAEVRAAFLGLSAWAVFDDVRPALMQLAAVGWRNVILSNHVPELPELVTALGLEDLIERVITSALTGYEKPNAAMFDLALELSGRPDRVWMVGDNPSADVDGATAVGIPALLCGAPTVMATAAPCPRPPSRSERAETARPARPGPSGLHGSGGRGRGKHPQ